MSNAQLMFWVAAALLFYIYLGYPMLIWLWAGWRGRHGASIGASPSPASGRLGQPRVSLLVVAHNEEARIAARIENLLALDYPSALLEIVIVSDGSTDSTVACARAYAGNSVRIEEFAGHRGKPAVLNQLIPSLTGDIVVLMDVRQRIEPQALQALLANFSDPRIGAVSGELVLEKSQQAAADRVGESAANASATGDGVGFYWRYEKFIRRQEARVDSTVGVTGAIYAIRRSLFRPIPAETLLDDVLIPMLIVRQGYRVGFDSSARAFDLETDSAQVELKRKVRTIAGNCQLFFLHPWLLNPFLNRLWFQTVSHKFLRLLSPLCLLTVMIANLYLLGQLFYQISFAAQILFYLAAISARPGGFVVRPRILSTVPYAFCLLNWATLVGFLKFVFRRQRVTWK